MDIDELKKLMETEEELHPDLRLYLFENEELGTKMLHHPLLIELFYNPIFNARINRSYQMKKDYIEKALKERNWSGYLGMHERPYRLTAFRLIHADMTDSEYWEHVSWLWTDTENFYQHNKIWRSVWKSRRPGRERVMDDAERDALAEMPERITVYRGTSYFPNGLQGMSWTVDRDKAIWFAKRYKRSGQTAFVATGKVGKKSVFAYLTGRNESEIVVFPERVTGVEVEEIKFEEV